MPAVPVEVQASLQLALAAGGSWNGDEALNPPLLIRHKEKEKKKDRKKDKKHKRKKEHKDEVCLLSCVGCLFLGFVGCRCCS